MRYLIAATLIAVGIIHRLLLSGTLGRTQLETLYSAAFGDANLNIRVTAWFFLDFSGVLRPY